MMRTRTATTSGTSTATACSPRSSRSEPASPPATCACSIWPGCAAYSPRRSPTTSLNLPSPAGLGTLDAALTGVAEFLRIDPDLIATAAAGSSPAASGEPTTAQLRTWVVGLPGRDKDAILIDLITGGDSHLRSRLLSHYRDAHPADASTPTAVRTAGQLLASAADLRAGRERRDAEQRKRDRVRRERSAAAARQRHLDTLAVDQPAVWQRVDELIATKKPREYDTAVQLLVDLRELSERGGDGSSFQHRLAELRAVHARKPSLLERLNLAGLDT